MTAKYKVMLRDNMAPVARELLEATGMIEVVVDNNKEANRPEALAEIIGEFHGLAVRSGTQVTQAVLDRAANLRVIGRAGIGVDNIDVPAATRKGVVVMNAPGGNTVTTAEHTISLILSLARNIPQATASLRAGKWEKKQFIGMELTGKTLGVIGLGHIGRVVANRAKGLKMRVIAADPFVAKEAAAELEIDLVTLDELYERADIITLHVPKLKETVNMINASSIQRMKKGVRLINCSRGDIVNLDDLYQAVVIGQIAGAALDVFPQEPPEYTHALFQDPRIIYTPHLGASTGEAQINVATMIAKEIAAFLMNDVISNAVNFPSVSREVMEKIRPHLDLAQKMGALMGQLVSKVHDITITYAGEMASLETKPLTHAIVQGLLSSFTDTPVNFVNAQLIAREKGIRIKETLQREKDDFAGTIRVKLEDHEMGPDEIWGTIFGNKHLRIVRLGKIYMDAIPEGAMIIIQNFDRPGVIGNVGTTLGKHNINIARFQLGRLGDKALCIVNIDSSADEQVIREIRNLPNIISAQQVRLK